MKKSKTIRPEGFNIDFFEFSFLVESCIPPVPIARAMFFQKVIDRYYKQLTTQQRVDLFEWINRTSRMQRGIEENNEDCILFNKRYNPDNQYLVTTVYNKKEEIHEAFKNIDSEGNERYYVLKNCSLVEENIIKVEKINIRIHE